MLAIVSLEHSNIMSDTTEDKFEPEKPSETDETAQTFDLTRPQPLATEEKQPGSTSPVANALPPEAQGEVNGGPLGCCLGIMIGLLLSLSLAILGRFFAEPLGNLFQNNYGLLGLIIRILMGVMAFALAIVFGYFGWKLGKRFYREYEPPLVKTRTRRSRSKKLQQKA